MVFRPVEVAMGKEWGFSLFAFLWDDDTFNSFLGMVHSREHNCTYFGIAFMNWLVDWNSEGEEDL